MPVPKQKHSPTRSKRDRSQWIWNKLVKMKKRLVLGACHKCGAKKMAHYACPECGSYADRQVIKQKTDKVTVIKA